MAEYVTDVNDPGGFSDRLDRQLDRVHDLDHDVDRREITRWVNDMATSGKATNTLTNRINPIRKLAERADKPLSEFESKADVTTLLSDFQSGAHPDVKDGGLAEGTIRQYRQAARLFFRDQLDREWGEDITVPGSDKSPITEEDVLSQSEIDALLENAKKPRDRALIAFLTVTGQRITAALSIQLGSLDFSDRTATVHLNDDAEGMKNASGPRPLLWSRSYINAWRNVHPRRGDPKAPLFCRLKSGKRPGANGTVSWEKGDVVTPKQMRGRLKRIAERAEVDTDKVNPHNFRHTAITRMRNENISDDRIKFMVGVAAESDILERYDHASDETMVERVREAHGMDIEVDETNVGKPTLEECLQCTAKLRSSARFCDTCGAPLTIDAADDAEVTTDAVKDDILDFEDPDKQEIALDALDEVGSEGEFVDAVAERVAERLDSHGSSS